MLWITIENCNEKQIIKNVYLSVFYSNLLDIDHLCKEVGINFISY